MNDEREPPLTEGLLNDLLADMYAVGGRPNMIRASPAYVEFHRKWIQSGRLVTQEKRAHRKRVKAARRRNRGRAPFCRKFPR